MVEIKYSSFFDRSPVLKAVKDGTASALSKFGAYVRQRAKTSIRKRKKVAPAGSPPSGHTQRLRDLIFFGYDTTTNSVVVGPQLFKQSNPPIPSLLEHGGTAVHNGKTVTYQARPFMEPALEAEQDKFAGLFSGAVKG